MYALYLIILYSIRLISYILFTLISKETTQTTEYHNTQFFNENVRRALIMAR